MKIKIAVEARVSADRKRCLETCPGFDEYASAMGPDAGFRGCRRYNVLLNGRDHLGRPLRCRACLKGEVKP